jgi:hypothetical protein
MMFHTKEYQIPKRQILNVADASCRTHHVAAWKTCYNVLIGLQQTRRYIFYFLARQFSGDIDGSVYNDIDDDITLVMRQAKR